MSYRLAIAGLVSAGIILALASAWVFRVQVREGEIGPAHGNTPVAAVDTAATLPRSKIVAATSPEYTDAPIQKGAGVDVEGIHQSSSVQTGRLTSQAQINNVDDSALGTDLLLSRGTSRRQVTTSSKRRAPQKQTARFVASAMNAARERPVEVLRALSRLQPSPERDAGLSHALSQWADTDPDQALTWVKKMPAGELRDRLGAAATTAAAEHDPIAAADFAATEMGDGVARNIAVVAIIQRWAQADPQGARQWAEQLPESSIRTDAFREIAVQERAFTNNK